MLDSRDQRDKLAIERAKLENEVAQLEQNQKSWCRARSCKTRGRGGHGGRGEGRGGGDGAEARLEEVENKTEDFLHDLLKQRKEEQKAVASMNEALGEVSAPEGVPSSGLGQICGGTRATTSPRSCPRRRSR